ncbi:MAG: DUF885 family protein [Vicinamibacterales bacterium]
MDTKRLHGTVAVIATIVVLSSVVAAGTLGSWDADERQPARPADWSPVQLPGPDQHPPELLQLAKEVRALRSATVRAGTVQDYAATAAKQKSALPSLKQKLNGTRTDGWSVHSKVDYLLLRSELDNLEFTLRVWRPTSRNPSFYVNAAINGVGRHLTGGRYMRGDAMPYSRERAQAILQALADTGPILDQGRKNLTEIVSALADVALEHPGGGYYTEGGQLTFIEQNYEKWARLTAAHFPQPEAGQLVATAAKAAGELKAFGGWLESNRGRMSGTPAIGLDALNWYTKHVLLMPYDASQLQLLAEMERGRAVSFFQFESHKNRHLPRIDPAKTYRQYLAWDDETALIIRRWYVEDQQILSDRDYLLDVKSEEGLYLLPFGLISFPKENKPDVKRILLVPPDHWRAVYSNMGFRTDPGVLHGHEYWPGHYYEGEVQRRNPCPVRPAHRDGAHSQGWCNYHEELPVHLDFPFVRGPRARELVYINNLQRADRILMGLKVLSGALSPKQAMAEMTKTVPPLGPGLGVRPEEAFEEIEGIIQRGLDHGMTGRLQIFQLLAERKLQLKDAFDFREFNDALISMGSVPLSLLRWELTGLDDQVKQLWSAEPLRATEP